MYQTPEWNHWAPQHFDGFAQPSSYAQQFYPAQYPPPPERSEQTRALPPVEPKVNAGTYRDRAPAPLEPVRRTSSEGSTHMARLPSHLSWDVDDPIPSPGCMRGVKTPMFPPREGLKTPPTRRRSRSLVLEPGDADRGARLDKLLAQLDEDDLKRPYAIVALPLPSPRKLRVHWDPRIEV